MKIQLQKEEIVSRITQYGRNWLVISPEGKQEFFWVGDPNEVPKVEEGYYLAAIPTGLDAEELREVAHQILDAEVADDSTGFNRGIWSYIERDIAGLDMDVIGYAHVVHPEQWNTYAAEAKSAIADIWLDDLNNLESPDAPWGYSSNGDGSYTPITLPFMLEWE